MLPLPLLDTRNVPSARDLSAAVISVDVATVCGGRRFGRRDNQPVPQISRPAERRPGDPGPDREGALGQKGARITRHIALPGRFLVYMPTVNHTGVSRKSQSDEERQRLKRILQSEKRQRLPGGFIVRTAGEGRSEEELRADIRFLNNLWADIEPKAEKQQVASA